MNTREENRNVVTSEEAISLAIQEEARASNITEGDLHKALAENYVAFLTDDVLAICWAAIQRATYENPGNPAIADTLNDEIHNPQSALRHHIRGWLSRVVSKRSA